VAQQQYAVVARLHESLSGALTRIGDMADLAAKFERRSAERRPMGGTVEFADGSGRTFKADLLDVSLTGLRCEQPPGFSAAPGARMQATLSAGRAVATVPVVVARAEDEGGKPRLGLAFDRLTAAQQNSIGQLLER
jgi:hypothetical protein